MKNVWYRILEALYNFWIKIKNGIITHFGLSFYFYILDLFLLIFFFSPPILCLIFNSVVPFIIGMFLWGVFVSVIEHKLDKDIENGIITMDICKDGEKEIS